MQQQQRSWKYPAGNPPTYSSFLKTGMSTRNTKHETRKQRTSIHITGDTYAGATTQIHLIKAHSAAVLHHWFCVSAEQQQQQHRSNISSSDGNSSSTGVAAVTPAAVCTFTFESRIEIVRSTTVAAFQCRRVRQPPLRQTTPSSSPPA